MKNELSLKIIQRAAAGATTSTIVRLGCRLIVIGFALFSLEGNAQTLDDYLELAARNNPGLKASFSEYEASLRLIARTRGLDDPTLRLSAFGEMVETRVGQQSAALSIEQEFPWFGTLKARGDVAALMAEARLKRFIDARNELLYEVKAAYYPIYEEAQLIRLTKDNIRILETYKSLATVRFQNGKSPMVDVIRIDIAIDQAKAQIRILEAKKRSLEATFNALITRDTGSPVVIADTLIIPDLSGVIVQDSLQSNPRLAAQEKMMEASRLQQLVARKESMPVIGLGFSYIAIDKRPNMEFPGNGKDAYMPMISVSLPIYRKKYRSAVQEAELMTSYYSSLRADELNKLIGEFANSRYEIESGAEQFRMLHHHIALTKQAIRLLITGVENSGGSFEEVLGMHQTLLMHESERVKVVTRVLTALARMEYLAAVTPSSTN